MGLIKRTRREQILSIGCIVISSYSFDINSYYYQNLEAIQELDGILKATYSHDVLSSIQRQDLGLPNYADLKIWALSVFVNMSSIGFKFFLYHSCCVIGSTASVAALTKPRPLSRQKPE
jgi:hypothetical protein